MNKNEANENIIIPIKYLEKIKKRFPKIKYTENKAKKIINVKSFDQIFFVINYFKGENFYF